MTNNYPKSGNSNNLLIGCVITCIICIYIGIILYFYFKGHNTPASPMFCDRTNHTQLTTSCLCGTQKCDTGSYCSVFGCTNEAPDLTIWKGIYRPCSRKDCSYKEEHDRYKKGCSSRGMRLCNINELCKGSIDGPRNKEYKGVLNKTFIPVNDAPDQWTTFNSAYGEPCTLIADPSISPGENIDMMSNTHIFGKCCLV